MYKFMDAKFAGGVHRFTITGCEPPPQECFALSRSQWAAAGERIALMTQTTCAPPTMVAALPALGSRKNRT